ncbi:hypothetical protein H0H93_009335 [Arthromyces matolae]|nr:hypothetical protein H0H93_009335 [Arthromyces matolae]
MDPLLPSMAHIDFVTLVDNSWKNEGYINGVWGSNVIRNGSRSLSPEVKSQGFSDYLLTGNIYTPAPLPNFPNHQTLTRTVHMIYEGKAVAEMTWDKTLEQLIGYGKALLLNKHSCFLIAAIGREVKFWRFNKNDGFNCNVEAMVIGKNGVITFKGDKFQSPHLRPQADPLSIVLQGQYVKALLDAIN